MYNSIIPYQETELIIWFKYLAESLNKKGTLNYIRKIMSKRIIIAKMHSPTFIFNDTHLLLNRQHHLLLIDSSIFIKIFNLEEISSLLLHELGHVFNIPIEKSDEDTGEFYADDYVRDKGFEKQLESSLEKYIAYKNNIDIKKLTIRLNRLKNNEELLIGKEWEIPLKKVKYY